MLDISSVYDFDGIDTAKPNIATQANPSQPSFYTRPARFIRIEKAVEIPDKTVRKINASAFGPAGMGMREILGYAPIQPDGSVQIQVPANVPFTIDVLDANARRITAQHTSWLQLLPGETKSCNGCHTVNPTNPTSHGRSGLTQPVNQGAPTTGQPFPSTNTALFANAGETMAQTLARISCTKGSAIPCSQILATDVLYANVWTTGVTLPATLPADAPISYTYGGTAGYSGIPADQRELHGAGLDRAMPHHDSLREREFEPNRTLYTEPVELLAAYRDRERRRQHECDLHAVPQHHQCQERHTSARGTARLDRRGIERRPDRRHFLRASPVPT